MEKDLKNLLVDELCDMLNFEKQIVQALPAVIKASEAQELKEAFTSHLKETKGQIQRLEKIFKLLKMPKKESPCKGMKGLIDECKEVFKDFKTKSPIRDAALISKVQRIEHYEIAVYGTARTFAKEIGLDLIVDLLQETLYEEGNADKELTKIAEGNLLKTGVNHEANGPSEAEPKKSRRKARNR